MSNAAMPLTRCTRGCASPNHGDAVKDQCLNSFASPYSNGCCFFAASSLGAHRPTQPYGEGRGVPEGANGASSLLSFAMAQRAHDRTAGSLQDCAAVACPGRADGGTLDIRRQ